jgi:hypothetical protein
VLVERLALQQRVRQRVEVRAVLGEHAIGLAVALLDDASQRKEEELEDERRIAECLPRVAAGVEDVTGKFR